MRASPRQRRAHESNDPRPEVAAASAAADDAPLSALDIFNLVSFYTSPNFSFPFILLFVLVTYFHESHLTPMGVLVGAWIVIQFTSFVIKEDFRNDLFWSIFRLIGNLIFYLFIGYLWSMAKLYLDIWQGHLNEELMSKIRVCISDQGQAGCVFSILSELKWCIVQWMVTWPVSIAYTISRDPFRVITDFIFEASRKRYLYIITSAMHARDSTEIQDTDLLSWALYFIGYMSIGYVWSHIKLFVDIWQKSLPPSLEQQARAVYAGDRNYWDFALQIKWLIIEWMITWPFSIVVTTLRHPVRIFADLIFRLSQSKYVWIIGKAMEAR